MAVSAVRPQALVFDLNETLLDLAPLRQAVNKAFDNPGGFRQWFGLLLQHAQTATLTGNYFNFSTIADAALEMAATMLEARPPSAEQRHELLHQFAHLPAHPDVAAGLGQLQTAGFRLFTLTNSAPTMMRQQLATAGIAEYFEQALSVDAGRLYKPHPDAYHYAAKLAGVEPAQTLMVAAHGWDVAGALAAGLQAAFIARPGQPLYPLAPLPAYQAPTITDLARQLLG
ncbi:haloacid dehalogenase type II [Hymenobacter sp. RP-2-7]|uniref:Haloacid dehalogenase type II n=1 Tax=Hymenobacter polaris TaxID=2682546 RepID=A0A7Y0AF03_9BACT|nr:haloacid dehalogenase type II [Hymenobacter polaris]NML66114.1 haloacid dehalogenase type II [Hymenobacter polaris]